MKKILILFLLTIITVSFSFAQNVAINADGSLPNSSAMLDVKSANKGMLIPRVALTGTDDNGTIISPTVSLMIYNTATTTGANAVTPGFYFRTASAWQKVMNVPAATSLGQTLYWNGTDWVAAPAGQPGQYFQIGQNNLPVWTGAAYATLTTTVITGTTYFANASGGGNITNDGGSTVTAKGICWSTTQNPTTANPKTVDGSGTGAYGSGLSGLSPSTLYYVRAYATSSPGTAYGNEVSFTTVPHALPALTTTAVTGITGGTANSGVTVTSENGSPVTVKGVCWSTSPNPTTANSKTTDGAGLGTVSSFINALNLSTTYYLRAYATNGFGTAYGNEFSFATTSNVTIGGSYQGGIVAYIFQSGDPGYVAGQTHGLIATPTDQSASAQWTNNISISGVTATALGAGNNNTQSIYSTSGSSFIAAALCFNLSSGGYNDWWLPSKDELNKLYLNKIAIGGFNPNLSYWSSSQNSSPSYIGWYQFFPDGFQDYYNSSPKAVRAVRQF